MKTRLSSISRTKPSGWINVANMEMLPLANYNVAELKADNYEEIASDLLSIADIESVVGGVQ